MSESAKHRILVVDDEPMIRRALIRLLKGSYEVVEATEAIPPSIHLQSTPFAALICGGAPSSHELLMLAREIQPRCRRIVSSSTPKDWSPSLVDAWLPRPWDEEELHLTLRKLLAHD